MSEMERIDRAADYVRDVLGTAEIAIVLGSGLGDYAEVLTDAAKRVDTPISAESIGYYENPAQKVLTLVIREK